MMPATINSVPSATPMPGPQRWARGQAFPEFLGVILPLMILLFAIVTLSLTVYSYSFVSEAARDAVRYAIVHGSSSSSPATATDIKNFVLNESHGLDQGQLTVSTLWSPNNNPGSAVSVKVTYDFKPLYPMSNVTLGLTSSARMVISR